MIEIIAISLVVIAVALSIIAYRLVSSKLEELRRDVYMLNKRLGASNKRENEYYARMKLAEDTLRKVEEILIAE
jgi:uncharacterized protein YoxC